ncbi:MAG: hypothetical protein ABSB83_03090 [Methanomassiliicoccales archaeon]|jgi:O-antigen/teichoic acid export membrane protein
MAFIATFNSLADLGFGAAQIKRVSEGKDINDCVSTYALLKIVLTPIMVVSMLASILIWASISGESYSSTTYEVILMFILYYVFYDIAGIATATFDARVEAASSQLSIFMDPLVRVPLVVFASLNRLSIVYLAYAFVMAGMSIAILSLVTLSRKKLYFCKPTLIRSYLGLAIPIALVSVMSDIRQRR